MLKGMERIEMGMGNALLRISEREPAAGQIWPGVALEFEHHRFGAALDPDSAAHNSFDAVVNLAPHYAVMNAKSHAPTMPDFARTTRLPERATSYFSGSLSVKVLPTSSWLETSRLPPWASTIALQIARPRPLRPWMRERDLSAR